MNERLALYDLNKKEFSEENGGFLIVEKVLKNYLLQLQREYSQA